MSSCPRILSVASVIVLVACVSAFRDDALDFRAGDLTSDAARRACAEQTIEPHSATEFFPQVSAICIADTDFNSMSVLAVVDRTPPSRPSALTRAALTQRGSMGRYDIATWGLNADGDLTFLATKDFIDVMPNVRILVGTPYNGCVAIGNLDVRRSSPESSSSCLLQLHVRGR